MRRLVPLAALVTLLAVAVMPIVSPTVAGAVSADLDSSFAESGLARVDLGRDRSDAANAVGGVDAFVAGSADGTWPSPGCRRA